ncbi:phage major capsid protein [Clostridium massiliamazoniense]|uniref:phage major capsid protein n=1 Tax=Clostridium massiliamazoniense TaxID=1347366 RepID=UPI0006D8175F|nr:phage major capsid protein [Clostridium massiliamazoniense]
MKKIDEMKQNLEGLKNEVQNFLNKNKIADAKAKMEEVKNMKEAIAIQEELDKEEMERVQNMIKEEGKKIEGKEVRNKTKAFINTIKSEVVKGFKMSKEDIDIVNATTMTEGVDKDGGLTVPRDVRTEIKELRKADDSLELLVHTEKTTTLSGSRIIEVNADHTPFDNVEEAEQFPEISTPEFRDVEYKVKKKGGILNVTRELLEDSDENILAYLKNWIAKKSKATRNALVVAKLKEVWGKNPVQIANFDDLKDILNVQLDTAYEATSIVLLNQDAFNYLDKLKDGDGKYILQPDPTNATKKLLFGLYPVKKVSNKTMPTVEGKAPVYIGDLKEAITIFDRESLSIDFNDRSDSTWKNDKVAMKVRERLDIQEVVEEAMIGCEITIGQALKTKK